MFKRIMISQSLRGFRSSFFVRLQSFLTYKEISLIDVEINPRFAQLVSKKQKETTRGVRQKLGIFKQTINDPSNNQ